jgi:hypothetical protein
MLVRNLILWFILGGRGDLGKTGVYNMHLVSRKSISALVWRPLALDRSPCSRYFAPTPFSAGPFPPA